MQKIKYISVFVNQLIFWETGPGGMYYFEAKHPLHLSDHIITNKLREDWDAVREIMVRTDKDELFCFENPIYGTYRNFYTPTNSSLISNPKLKNVGLVSPIIRLS